METLGKASFFFGRRALFLHRTTVKGARARVLAGRTTNTPILEATYNSAHPTYNSAHPLETFGIGARACG